MDCEVHKDHKLFCAIVESACRLLEDPRLETRRGTIEVLNEYGKYLQVTKSKHTIYWNQTKCAEGVKIWFEV